MKIQLWPDSGEHKVNGYLNLCSYVHPDGETDELKKWDLTNLDGLVSDAEADEITVNGVIGYIPLKKVMSTIQNWSNKICRGGKITIIDVDAMKVCRDFSDFKIDIDAFNGILFGDQNEDSMVRYNCLAMDGLCNHLTSLGYKIIRKNIDNYAFVIEGQKI